MVHVAAFASLRVQIDGLIGARGISPAADFLAAVDDRYGRAARAALPTIFWHGASDAALHRVCDLGIAGGALLALGVAPPLLLVVLFYLYLSIVNVGDVFLGYQWDALLLETSILAVLLGPIQPLLHRSRTEPPRAAIWLLRLLLFRLMFLSGWVKLASGDPAWRSLRALDYHYWTQPIPTWTSWYAASLPEATQRGSCLLMFAIELGAPFLMLGNRRCRQIAFAALATLQLAIAATGNYGFFNLLALALCVPLLDDQTLRAWFPPLRRRRLPDATTASPAPPWRARAAIASRVAHGALALIFALASLHVLVGSVSTSAGSWIPTPFARTMRTWSAISSYGLFAVMTTTRPEILVEGSDDGHEWKPYVFRWKPGPLDRRPAFTTPHMPRLDWQMWFAALDDCHGAPWFEDFERKLLEGEPAVTRLLASNPFPDRPPKMIRSTVWQYRFGDRTWWTRTESAPFCPPAMLDGAGGLAPAP